MVEQLVQEWLGSGGREVWVILTDVLVSQFQDSDSGVPGSGATVAVFCELNSDPEVVSYWLITPGWSC